MELVHDQDNADALRRQLIMSPATQEVTVPDLTDVPVPDLTSCSDISSITYAYLRSLLTFGC